MKNIREITLKALETKNLGDENVSRFETDTLLNLSLNYIYDDLYNDLILYTEENISDPETTLNALRLSFKLNRFEANTHNPGYDAYELYSKYDFKYSKTLYSIIAKSKYFIDHCNSLLKRDLEDKYHRYSSSTIIRQFMCAIIDSIDADDVNYIYDNFDRNFMNIEFCVIGNFDSLYNKLNDKNKEIINKYCENMLFDSYRIIESANNKLNFPSCFYHLAVFNDWKDKLTKILDLAKANDVLDKMVELVRGHASWRYSTHTNTPIRKVNDFCSSYYYKYMKVKLDTKEFKEYILDIHQKNKNFYCYSDEYKDYYNMLQILE